MRIKRGVGGLSLILLTLIVAVLSFTILIYFTLTSNTNEYTVDEICRLSVLTRAITPDIPTLELKQNIPLKCTTKKVCITDDSGFLKTGIGKGRCEQFAGEDELKTEVISGSDYGRSANAIEKVVAEEMLSCWKMMGEGKVDLVSKNSGGLFDDKAEPACIICSRIAFDEDFVYEDKKEDRSVEGYGREFNEIKTRIDINDYLSNEQAPESKKTFLQLFTDDSVRSLGSYESELDGGEEGKQTTEIAILFSQINTGLDPAKAAEKTALWGAGFVAGAAGAFSPVRKIVLRNPIGFFTTLAGIGIASGVAYVKADTNQAISAAYCGDFVSSGSGGDSLRNGCSVVTAVDYSDIGEINRICKGGIFGSP